MIYNERVTRKAHLLWVAQQMMTAARTAPKAKGLDLLEIVCVEGDTIVDISECLKEQAIQTGLGFMLRDAANILHAEVLILIGSIIKPQGLNCGFCGFATCSEKKEHPAVYCDLNSVDLGIAVGSACATAADLRVDSRVMFSVGFAAKQLNLLPSCQSIYGIPISASSKNPFFDRK